MTKSQNPAEKVVRLWWKETISPAKDVVNLSYQNAYNCRNMLAGFLQACEKFEHLTHEESQDLFQELAK
jgi:hypothetical protein